MEALADRLRRQWSPDGWPIVLYTGTLEKYQGVTALVEAMKLVESGGIRCRLVVVGGSSSSRTNCAAPP